MFETEERLYFPQKSSGYKAKILGIQRSKRRFLLGKTTFLIFQAAPGLPTYRTPRNGSPFRGVLHSCSCFGGGQRHLGAGLYYSLIGRVSSHLS